MILDHYRLFSILGSVLFFGVLLTCMEVGALWARRGTGAGDARGAGAIEGALLALLGLLIAFTFSGAADRLHARGNLAIDEGDAIGTAFLRMDLLPDPERMRIRGLLYDYAAARLGEYAHFGSTAEHEQSRAATAVVRARLWSALVPAASRIESPHALALVLEPVNESFDIADRREAYRQVHPPFSIYAVLVAVAMVCAALVGFGLADTQHRRWLHRTCFAAAIAIILLITINMEYPRLGFVDMSGQDWPLQQALEEMQRIP
jgi:hypothetical protein